MSLPRTTLPLRRWSDPGSNRRPGARGGGTEGAWTDLSVNRPGAAARERALAERDAAPIWTLLARVLGVNTDERAWRISADGEEAVAAQLAKLGPEWVVGQFDFREA